MTEQQYVASKLSRWDTIMGNFFFAPALVLVGMILTGLLVGIDDHTERIVAAVFVILLVISVIFRLILSGKIQRLKDEYESIKDWLEK